MNEKENPIDPIGEDKEEKNLFNFQKKPEVIPKVIPEAIDTPKAIPEAIDTPKAIPKAIDKAIDKPEVQKPSTSVSKENNNKTIYTTLFKILFLLSCSISASIFMVTEISSFFIEFYSDGNKFLGVWVAILNELFLIVLIMLEGVKKKKNPYFYYSAKFVIVALFFNTVIASSSFTISKHVIKINEQLTVTKNLQNLENEIKDKEESIKVFTKQNQKTNSALEIRKKQEIREEIRKNQTSSKIVILEYIKIFLTFFIRLSIQLSSIICVWYASRLYSHTKIG